MQRPIHTRREKEHLFSALMYCCLKQQQRGKPIEREHPIEVFLDQLEIEAGMDGLIYRAIDGRFPLFQLVEMSEEEFEAFHLLLTRGWITL